MRSRALAAILLAGAAAGCGGTADRPLDLILVSVDTLRADRLPFYGGPRDVGGDPAQEFTPSWLATQGTVFETCWSDAGQTLPSLGAFWTGLTQLEHGGVANDEPVLVPTRLSAWKGKRFDAARALLANQSLGAGCGLQNDFDTYGLMPKQLEPRIPEAMLQETAADVAAGKRLLVWAHFMAPHQPYAPPADLLARYGAGPFPTANNEFLYDLHRQGAIAPELRAQLEALYDAEIRAAAGYVRELLAGLDAQYRAVGRGGLLENAIVVFFSDHGEELGDRHGYSLHAKSLYSGVIRVPLVVVGPGWTARREARALRLAEVLPWVVEGVQPKTEVFCSSWRSEFYAARDARWTLVHNPSGNPVGPREPPTDAQYPYPALALYDRAADPREQQDVSAQHPEEARRLLRALNAWYESLRFADASAASHVDPAALADLGYVDNQGQSLPIRLAPHPADSWDPPPPR
jgi:arylsulfatase A-like enzyme